MARTRTLRSTELQVCAQRLQQGTLHDVQQVYAQLHGKGYGYAGWGGALSREGVPLPLAEAGFLTGPMLMGWCGHPYRSLPQTARQDMHIEVARRYLNTLLSNCIQAGGATAQDVSYDEVRQIQQNVLQHHHLSLAHWTLHTPMELLRSALGDAVVADLWNSIRDLGGDGLEGTLATIRVYRLVSEITLFADPALCEQVLAWMRSTELAGRLRERVSLSAVQAQVEHLVLLEALLSAGSPNEPASDDRSPDDPDPPNFWESGL